MKASIDRKYSIVSSQYYSIVSIIVIKQALLPDSENKTKNNHRL